MGRAGTTLPGRGKASSLEDKSTASRELMPKFGRRNYDVETSASRVKMTSLAGVMTSAVTTTKMGLEAGSDVTETARRMDKGDETTSRTGNRLGLISPAGQSDTRTTSDIRNTQDIRIASGNRNITDSRKWNTSDTQNTPDNRNRTTSDSRNTSDTRTTTEDPSWWHAFSANEGTVGVYETLIGDVTRFYCTPRSDVDITESYSTGDVLTAQKCAGLDHT